ncbi:MAG: transglutaminase-like domain-containing protein [Planctomycetota bacterium]
MPAPPAVLRFAAALLVLCVTAIARSSDHDYTREYIVGLSGSDAGTLVERRTTAADGNITTRNEMKLAIRRGTTVIEAAITTEFVETADHRPVSMLFEQRLAQQPTIMRYRFGPETIEVRSTTGSRTITSEVPMPGHDWLTPVEVDAFIAERLRAGAATIEYKGMDPASGAEILVNKLTDIEARTIEVNGRVIDGFSMTVAIDGTPELEPSTEFRDNDGVMVTSTVSIGELVLTFRPATDADAGRTFEAPELLVSTFVRPDRVIERPRSKTRARYRLSMTEGRLPEIVSAGGQRVVSVEPDGTTIIEVSTGEFLPAGELDRDTFLAATAMLDAEDNRVAGLARVANRTPGDAAAKAEALRRQVFTTVRQKNLETGFASASEVARTREGDCTEHAVLLAAMLRAADIPSRVVAGLIYAEDFGGASDIFGYHMWTQALVTIDGEERWIDLDATLPDAVPFDATHIAISTSAMSDGEATMSLASVAAVLGRLEIAVLEVE